MMIEIKLPREPKVCQSCGVEYLGNVYQRYCPMCARERKLESRRRERRWYKENGWCYDCGREAVPGKSRCAECAAKVREGMRGKKKKA